jgi:hypothetical protein
MATDRDPNAEVELTFEPGKRGRTRVTARVGTEMVLRDTFDLDSLQHRRRFIAGLRAKGITVEGVLTGVDRKLMDEADRLALREGAEDESEDDGPTTYTVVEGCISRVVAARDGEASTVPMANFDARIVEEVIRDDGLERSRRLALEGELASSGEALPKVEISSEDFM